MNQSWELLRFHAELLRLDADIVAVEKLAAGNPIIPKEANARAEAAWKRLMGMVGAS